jgi:hypothetical protein
MVHMTNLMPGSDQPLRPKHQLMTASVVHVTNLSLTPPHSQYGPRNQSDTPGVAATLAPGTPAAAQRVRVPHRHGPGRPRWGCPSTKLHSVGPVA